MHNSSRAGIAQFNYTILKFFSPENNDIPKEGRWKVIDMSVQGRWENKNKKKKEVKKKATNQWDIKKKPNKGKLTLLKGVKKEAKRRIRQRWSYNCTGQELRPPAKDSGLSLPFTLYIQILRGSLRQQATE